MNSWKRLFKKISFVVMHKEGGYYECSKYHILTEEEIKANKILSLFTECTIKWKEF